MKPERIFLIKQREKTFVEQAITALQELAMVQSESCANPIALDNTDLAIKNLENRQRELNLFLEYHQPVS
jgi:L-asparaginase II